MWEKLLPVPPGLSVRVGLGPGTAGSGKSVIVEASCRTHGRVAFVHGPGGPEEPMAEGLRRWADAAPVEAARYILDVMSDALRAGATADDLVFTVAEALASTVMDE